jgi:ubiquinone/menaquinone biosynthesis C-methylase UbiE
MARDLQKLVIDEFNGENAQRQYLIKAEEGLWDSETHFIAKYFIKGRRILDMGCGTGRTTIELSRMGYKVIGVDIARNMIFNARKIAKKKWIDARYIIGDATNTKMKGNSFDYVLFSNNGWTHIPGKDKRLKALSELRRVLKKGGVLIFTAHNREWSIDYSLYWLWQWIRFNVLKRVGFDIDEVDFGDRFFTRETSDNKRTFMSRQYIHIPSIAEVCDAINQAGLAIVEINGRLQVNEKKPIRYNPVFYVCQKK